MIYIRAVTHVLTTNAVCIMHLNIALKMEDLKKWTHCNKLTRNPENKCPSSIKMFSPTHIRLFVLTQSIYSENTVHLFIYFNFVPIFMALPVCQHCLPGRICEHCLSVSYKVL